MDVPLFEPVVFRPSEASKTSFEQALKHVVANAWAMSRPDKVLVKDKEDEEPRLTLELETKHSDFIKAVVAVAYDIASFKGTKEYAMGRAEVLLEFFWSEHLTSQKAIDFCKKNKLPILNGTKEDNSKMFDFENFGKDVRYCFNSFLPEYFETEQLEVAVIFFNQIMAKAIPELILKHSTFVGKLEKQIGYENVAKGLE